VLSKCANPSCSAPFRYLHEGKLFRIEIDVQLDRAAGSGRGVGKTPSRLEFFWLCDSCSTRMTVAYTRDQGVAVIPLRVRGAAS
jgi:hypothetical protein